MHHLSVQLEAAIDEYAPRLRALTDKQAEARVGHQPGWSRKEELGHLFDSATNNRVRFLFAALAGRYSGPTYDGEGWVRLGGYRDVGWPGLVDAWQHANRLLILAIANIPDSQASVPCTVGEGEPVTLAFLIEDYIHHMQHHLAHIAGTVHE